MKKDFIEGAKAATPIILGYIPSTIIKIFFSCSIAGINKDQILAATITPDAIPEKHLDKSSLFLFFKKYTQAAPKVVPKKGISNPNHIIITIVSLN